MPNPMFVRSRGSLCWTERSTKANTTWRGKGAKPWSSLTCFTFTLFLSCLNYAIDRFTVKFICQNWDSNRGSLVSEATALQTAPQPRPNLFSCNNISQLLYHKVSLPIISTSFSGCPPATDPKLKWAEEFRSAWKTWTFQIEHFIRKWTSSSTFWLTTKTRDH